MRIDPEGFDLGWFAIDQDGHLGFFTSAGSRVVPETVLQSQETWDVVNRSIQKLPPQGKGTTSWLVRGNRKDWLEMADRGLFAYDFDVPDPIGREKGAYKLIATPAQPVNIEALESTLAQALRSTTLNSVCFAKTKSLKHDLINLNDKSLG